MIESRPMKVFGIVYGLYDPDTQALRYVGQTVNGLARRLANHLSPSGLKKHLRVASCLKNLLSRGLMPDARILAVASTREQLDELEIRHIASAIESGADLTNLCAGGKVNSGFKKSADAVAKIIQARVGSTTPDSTKKKISQAMTGRKVSNRTRILLGHAGAGRSLSAASRAKMRESKRHQGEYDAYIWKRSHEGATQTELAGETGLHQSSISRILIRLRKSHPLRGETARQRQKPAPDG